MLSRAELVEKWQEEEKIPVKKPAAPKPAEEKKEAPKEGETAEKPAEPETVQEYETKIKKKSTSTPLQFSYSFFGWLDDAITKFRETEAKLYTADR